MSNENLDRFLRDDCRNDEMHPYSLFDLYRAAITEIASFPPPPSLDLQHTAQSYFTDHGSGHLRRVQLYAEELIKKSNLGINCCEALLLLLSIWLHDLAMLFKLNPAELDVDIRDSHHERVMSVLARIRDVEQLHLPSLPPGLDPLIEKITRAHRRAVDISTVEPSSTVNQNSIRVRLLAAIVRISDASDMDNRRAPEAVFEMYEPAIPETSKLHWRRNAVVAGVTYDSLSSSVWINVLPPEGRLIDVIRHLEVLNWLNEELRAELQSVQNVFRDYNIHLFHVQMIDHVSGKPLELGRPPSGTSCFMIIMRQSNLPDELLTRLETVIEQHPGNYEVAVEVRTDAGTMVHTVPNLTIDGSPEAKDAIGNVLGVALTGYEVRSMPPEDIRRVTS